MLTNRSTEKEIRDYYQTKTIGFVCTESEDEFVKDILTSDYGNDCIGLRPTKNPVSIHISRARMIYGAIKLGDDVLEPVVFAYR